jgi:hypothetical protein
MPSDQLIQSSPVGEQAAALPPTIVTFLELCLLAGLVSDFAVVVAATLHHQQNSNGGQLIAHAVAALILGAIFFPFVALPYWLALAFVYARNDWARGLLYFVAVVTAITALAAIGKSGPFSLQAMCMLIVAGLEIAALVFLHKPPSRDWLRRTAPGFALIASGP